MRRDRSVAIHGHSTAKTIVGPEPRNTRNPTSGCCARGRCPLHASSIPKGLCSPAQGREERATLIGLPKLFSGGEESLWGCSPQPPVNNFARRSEPLCEQDCCRAEGHAVTPRWMTNKLPVSFDEFTQSFAPARRLGSRRILRCRQSDVSAIRPSLNPSQRVRSAPATQ